MVSGGAIYLSRTYLMNITLKCYRMEELSVVGDASIFSSKEDHTWKQHPLRSEMLNCIKKVVK